MGTRWAYLLGSGKGFVLTGGAYRRLRAGKSQRTLPADSKRPKEVPLPHERYQMRHVPAHCFPRVLCVQLGQGEVCDETQPLSSVRVPSAAWPNEARGRCRRPREQRIDSYRSLQAFA